MNNSADLFNNIDTCALSDALDSLGLDGVAEGIQRRSGQRIAGRARTMTLARREQAPPGKVHLGASVIMQAEPGEIIVIEQHTGLMAGSWGGLLATAAVARNIQGVVVDGPVRDIDDYQRLEFPVFSATVTPRTARGRIVEIATGQPVCIGGITVKPGDYVVADGSGVVFVAAAHIETVLPVARRIVNQERLMSDAIKAGGKVTEVLDMDYEDMLKTRS